MAQTEFEGSFWARPLRFWIFICISSFAWLPIEVANDGIPPIIPFAVFVAAIWLIFGVLVAAFRWIWLRRGCRIRVLPDALEVLMGKRTIYRLHWADIEAVRRVPGSPVPLIWKPSVWLLGWPQRELADVYLRHMMRATFKGPVTTRGFGLPYLVRHLYLSLTDVERFVRSAQSRLSDASTSLN